MRQLEFINKNMFDYITTSNAKNPKVNVNAQKRKICSHSIITIPGKHAE